MEKNDKILDFKKALLNIFNIVRAVLVPSTAVFLATKNTKCGLLVTYILPPFEKNYQPMIPCHLRR